MVPVAPPLHSRRMRTGRGAAPLCLLPAADLLAECLGDYVPGSGTPRPGLLPGWPGLLVRCSWPCWVRGAVCGRTHKLHACAPVLTSCTPRGLTLMFAAPLVETHCKD